MLISLFLQHFYLFKLPQSNPVNSTIYPFVSRYVPVKEYLKGGIGLAPLAIKHKIPSDRQIRAWIKEYNGHEGNLKAYKPNGGITMTKGRKTTFEERIEIVEDCLKNGGDYSATASKFKISYYQIYSWVDKYKNNGIASLKDNRGKGKSLEDMDKLEQLEAENRLLRAKLERLKMEVELKKNRKKCKCVWNSLQETRIRICR